MTLSATDAGSGVDAIRYTTDGSEPTSSSPAYTGAITVDETKTIRWQAWDKAGNAESTRTQLLKVDRVDPTVTITSPAEGASIDNSRNVQVQANASDDGAGVFAVLFYKDGSLVGYDNTAPYAVTWTPRKKDRGRTALTAVAFDRAGNWRRSTAVTVNVR